MASLYKKTISGKPYWYLREMGREDGKPKMHLRFAVHPAHFAQVPVRLPADRLLVQTRHTLGHTRSCARRPPATPTNPRSTQVRPRNHAIKTEIARKVPLASARGRCCTPGGHR